MTARETARALRRRYRDLRDGPAEVRARLEALEAEVQEQRQLNRRIAELTDIVTELLLPLQDRDTERIREVLDDYRGKI